MAVRDGTAKKTAKRAPRPRPQPRARSRTHGLTNAAIGAAFEDIADLLEIDGQNPFRVRAYRRAARTLAGLQDEASALVARGDDLNRLPGIGEDLAGKIADLATAGSTPLLDELRRKFPSGLVALLKLPALGPKRVALLNRKLGIEDAASLKRALAKGKLDRLAGFGPKLRAALAEALAPQSPPPRRFTLAEAAAEAEPLAAYLRKAPGVTRVEIAGSYRRGRETVGDIDLLAVSPSGAGVVAHFAAYPRAAAVLARGTTRAALRLASGMQADLRVVAAAQFGAALYYFTGSKAHNIAVRRIAEKRALKINEYGVFRGRRRIAGETEDSVFGAVDLPYIPPELREDRGEIDAARAGKLPRLLARGDMRGDALCRTEAGGGRDGLEALVEKARRHGLRFLLVADPCRRVASANHLDPDGLARQGAAIDRLNAKQRDVLLLKGVEAAIREDGGLDLPDALLAGLDGTVAAVEDGFGLPAAKQTARLQRALEHRHVRILARPFGRILGARAAMAFDLARVLATAKAAGRFLGLDARPDRLDPPDIACRAAKDAGVPVAIGACGSFEDLRWGIATARRGWLGPSDVLNARTPSEARSALKSGRM